MTEVKRKEPTAATVDSGCSKEFDSSALNTSILPQKSGFVKRYRLNLTHEPVRALLTEFKRSNAIPCFVALNDAQRSEFEAWAIVEARRRGIDLFDNDGYRREIMQLGRALR